MIEILGYRLLRQLGQGGMATVYLARQESVDRDVALKVLLPGMLADTDFAEHFLREARIAAGLEHRHVVSIHDVGHAGGHHYIAMEYLSGGPVRSVDGRGYPIAFSLRVVRQIAKALDYAHSQGIVHRDVTPDNILLRNDGAAVLTDFGIARGSGMGKRSRAAGAMIGSPHYMSPEWVRGDAIDGRADLYSLGAVLYELLTGRPPYVASDPRAVAQMHLDEPVPMLPRELAALQGLLERFMAKDPAGRFQSGMEAAQAIKGMQEQLRTLNDSLLDGAQVMAAAMGDDEAQSGILPDVDRQGRISPSVGALDELSIGMAERRSGINRRQPPPRVARAGWRLPGLLLATLVATSLLWLGQDWLRAQWPRTEINQLVLRGQIALEEGHLVGSDGDSARELFEAALAQSPDRSQIHDGLRAVGEQLLQSARQAMYDDDLIAATAALEQAQQLLGGGNRMETLRQEINQRQAGEGELGTLLAQADARFEAQQLIGSDSAANRYRQVGDLDPGNALARAGLERIAAQLARQTRELLAAGDLDAAAQTVDTMDEALAGHADIAGLRGELAQARSEQDGQLTHWLEEGRQALQAGRLEGDNSAQQAFELVLDKDPGNAEAHDGLHQVARGWVLRAHAALEDDGIAAAGEYLLQATRLAPALPELEAAQVQLREASERAEIDAQRSVVTGAQREQLRAHLADAERAVRAGNLIVPPGQSAYDHIRAALAIDGQDSQALAALQRLPEQAGSLFDRALTDGTPYRARIMYETAQQLAARDDALALMRRKLTDAFLHEAQRRLGDGNRGEALRALEAVRGLDADHPRLPALQERAQGLSGS